MIVNLSDLTSNTALDAIGVLMNGGVLELLTASGTVLARLRLSDPATAPAIDGEMEFNTIHTADAVAGGTAKFARIVARSGAEIFSCDVGDLDSEAVIRLSPVTIVPGAPVKINSFRLSMP